MSALPLAIISGWTKPIGMYFLISEETFGINKYGVFGCRISPNKLGVDASLRVVGLPLPKRNFRTVSMRSFSNWLSRKRLGGASTSHRHHLSVSFKNSSPPYNRRM